MAASYQCVEDVPAPGDLTATDACQGDITVTGVDSDNNGAGCADDPLIITRTWTFDDGCGNQSSVSQTITVVDDTAPVWDFGCVIDTTYTTSGGADCPADAEISLNEGDVISVNDGWLAGGISIPSVAGCVSDNCTAADDLLIRVVGKTKTGDSCSSTLTITFEAEDACRWNFKFRLLSIFQQKPAGSTPARQMLSV